MKTRTPRLTIIIVSYNSKADLDACLRSLTTQAPRLTHEIVVVDNASSDGTPGYVRDCWPGVRLIEAGSNIGFASANNRGIRSTASELVLLLNPDTIVPAGAVDRLVAALDARPGVAIAGPRLVDGSGRAELSFGRTLSPWAEFQQRRLVTGNDRGVPSVVARVDRLTRETKTVGWVSGACLLIRRSELEAAGGMDERFFMYAEDVDLCAAVRARGRTVLFCAEVEIVHLRGRSALSAPRAAAAAYRRSQIAFYEKHHRLWSPVLKVYLTIRGQLPGPPGARE
jgi:N-acetylglucosaminyl-diphospho-decaprenol L-rhamnosyltransferase